MKILHIVEASFAGVGRHVLDLAAGQAARGHDVHVGYSPVRESESFSTERMRMDNITFHKVPMTRTIGMSDISAATRMMVLVSRIRPQVIHGHSTKGGLLARAVPTLLCGDFGTFRPTVARMYTPNAVYSMNPGLTRKVRTGVGLIERLLSYRTDVVIAVSPEEKRHLLSIGINQSRVVVVPNGIPIEAPADRLDTRAELELPIEATVVGFVGRLDEQKNPMLLVRAFAFVATDRDNLVLSIVGDGPLRETMRRQISALGLEDRVWLHGEHPGRRAMAAFDLFVLPSRYEGFPYVLIEAAQAGLRIVTTIGACAEQLRIDGRYGSVVAVSGSESTIVTGPAVRADPAILKSTVSNSTVSTPDLANRETLTDQPHVTRDAEVLGQAIIATLDDLLDETSRELALESGRRFTVEAMVDAVENHLNRRVKPMLRAPRGGRSMDGVRL